MRRQIVVASLLACLIVTGCVEDSTGSKSGGTTTIEFGPYGLHPDLKDGVEDCVDLTEDFLAWYNPGIVRSYNAFDAALDKGIVMWLAQAELAGEQFDLFSLVVTCEELFPRIWSGTIDKIATAIDDCALMRFDSTASASAITKSNKAIAQCGISNQRTKTSTGQLREKLKVLKEWID
jgi:hypothetical protein